MSEPATNVLDALLEAQGVAVLDGAQGTELERRGVQLGTSKLWSAQLLIDDPALVQAIHLDYLRAGSDVITTFTYQASLQGFADAGIDAATAASLLNRAVDLAEAARQQFLQEQADAGRSPVSPDAAAGREPGPTAGPAGPSSGATAGGARDPHQQAWRRQRPLIAFSCGSYGGYLADGSEFGGDYAESTSLDQLADFHAARLEPVRHRPEIDLIAFETVPCVKEAEAIIQLLRRERYGKPAWISFSCRDAVHTCHGEDFAAAAVPLLAAAEAEGLVVAGGVNCTPPRFVDPLLAAARRQLAELQEAERPPPAAPAAAASASSTGIRGEAGAGPVSGPGSAKRRGGLLLLAYPNSGEDWDGEHRCWRHAPDDIAEPGAFAAAAAGWVAGGADGGGGSSSGVGGGGEGGPARRAVARGAALVGGCCRTGPQHIRALRAKLLGGA
ncbi:hypothetical protein HYH03_017392 [Edaphochlamys debaryana]|uniref:Hcy-binding domain-containing protein n=1 Tax=Edaphochlamys debaryana TaxID=47281 RepID=A0A835XFR0_9CHLO|nr:hypothetical protein HYH03_017392 [Edaphochlamys debaryana]|eukprot:KAG2483737.1 hypothetical protein HYH03_017392 [Edaphochlamys debaryana]